MLRARLQDLASHNFLMICSALTAMTRLLNSETAPTVVHLILGLLNHQREVVRKKAVIALTRCWRCSRESLEGATVPLRRILCDRNPSVMAVSLSLFLEMSQVALLLESCSNHPPSELHLTRLVPARVALDDR